MNWKRVVQAAIAVFIGFFILEFVVHQCLLQDLYQRTETVWRPRDYIQKLMGFVVLGYLILSFMFSFIYAKGYEMGKAGWAQGLRYGLWIGLLVVPPMSLTWYVILPIPEILPILWTVTGLVEFLAVGLLVGWIYRT